MITYIVHEFKGPKEKYNHHRVVHLAYSRPEAEDYVNMRDAILDSYDGPLKWEIVEVE